ncbi:unnamed protein product [Lota lota]
MRRSRMPLGWATVWLLFCCGPLATQSGWYTLIGRLEQQCVVSPLNNGQFCSTWGNNHFKTFDGDFFQLPFTCTYILTSQCKSSYESFNIQLSRQQTDGVTSIERVTMKLDGVLVKLTNATITVNEQQITIPFSQYGISIQRKASFVRIEAKLGLVVMWNENDTLWVEMDEKFRNETCGLCGDYNGIQIYNEFINHDMTVSPVDYAYAWKVNAPTENCMEYPQETTNCPDQTNLCKTLLSDHAFQSCHNLLDIDSFVKACDEDLCSCANDSTCLCPTLSEFSRQCAHAGGTPQPWNTANLCAKECPFNMVYRECGLPCSDTCTQPHNSDLCQEHCESGCFCPGGTVLDDITHRGCIPLRQCYCQHNGKDYLPGKSFSGACRTCTCALGKWSCQEHDCPATCSIVGGSHITTYDAKSYTFHGECTYVLSKDTNGNYTVLGDIVKLSQTDTESLVAVTLVYGGQKKIKIDTTGKVFYNDMASELPLNIDDITVFKPSTFFVIVYTADGLQLEIQIVPTMQLYIKADASYKGQLLGLCGDFNDVEADDFKTPNGMIAGTAATYANTWKALPSCPDVSNKFGNPCSLSVDKEKYAKHWCALLSDPKGIFSACHSKINPEVYEDSCMHDTCLCKSSEDCLCATLSAYVHRCEAVGVSLHGWRNTICTKYSTNCPEGLVYSYNMTSCQRSCLSLSQPDVSCQVDFSPVDGCGCAAGTYMNEVGSCVPASQCLCYEGQQAIRPGQTVWKQGTTCTCKDGVLYCVGIETSCTAPMVYFNCSDAAPGVQGSECQKSCQSEHSECISARCISGCVCPDGLLSDGEGGCVKEHLCPCLYNGVSYMPGQTVKVDCNTCKCRARTWECTKLQCDGTCTIFGDGHYVTFDEKKFSFNGDCGYTFTQDYCTGDMSNGTFRVVTENIPCGSIDSTCSMVIKLFLGNTEIVLSDETIKVTKRSGAADIPYQVHSIGIYLVIEAQNGLILIWNRKTTVMIKLSPSFKGQVCGLCGNYDGSVKNDFTTRNREVVVEAVQFGNSWKVSPTCPDTNTVKKACQLYSYREAWALKHCSIIQSEVFAACHSQVDPHDYYDACVKDTCACNSGGDCECFCSAVEAYAAACNRAGACVRWRTPSICPLFCDFYNPIGECEWHYEPCGKSCLKTCTNPTATCSSQIPALEGCYPRCPPEQPYLEEMTMKCVSQKQCGCYDDNGQHYKEGATMPSQNNCETCHCLSTQKTCAFDVQACYCLYNGNKYPYGAKLYSTHDGDGTCFNAVCEEHGHINRSVIPCPPVTPTTTTPETTTPTSTPTTSLPSTTSTTTEPPTSTSTTEPPTTTSTTEPPTSTSTTEPPTTTSTTEPPTTTSTTEPPTSTSTTEPPTTTSTTEPPTTTSTTEPPTTTSTTEPPTTTSTTEPPTTTSTTEPPTTTSTTEPPTTTSTTEPPTSTSTTEQTSTTICPCEWTDWINKNYPNKKGDFETIASIKEIDLSRCKSSLQIECRSSDNKDIPLELLGQTVTCNTTVGLVCHNKDQTPVPRCNDYEIRVKCCDDKCQPTTTSEQSTTTSTTEPPTTTSTTEPPTTTSTTEPPTTTSTTEPPTSTSTTEQTSTTICPCEWTDWINKNYPNKKGDFETIASIKEIDLSRCKSSLQIECRSSDNKDIPLELLGQTVTCNTTVGLVCHNKDQTPVPRCNDYEIRVKCCDDKCQPTTTSEQSTTTSTTEPPTTTSTTEPPTTTSTTEPPTSTSTTEQSTTTTTTEPPTTTSTTEPPTTTSTTEPPTTTSTTEPPTTTSTTEPPTTTSTTEQTTTTTTEQSTTTTEQSTTTTTTEPPTTTSTTEQTTTTTTTEQTPTTICPCEWTDWINKNYPDKKGDFETIASIKEIDLSRCKSPLEIECRSSDNKDVPLELLGQTVTCNTTVGLVCHHKDQTPVPRCYDYEIRVKCCDDKCHSTTSTTEPPTSTSTTEPPTTTSTTEPPTTTSTTEPPTTTSTTEPPTTTSTTEPPTTTSTTEPPTTTSTTEPPTSTSTTEQSTTTTTTEPPTTTSTTEPPTTTSTTEPPTTTSTTEPPTTTSTTEPPTTTSTTEQTTTTTTEQSTTTTEQSTTTTTTEPPTTTSTTEQTTTTTTTEQTPTTICPCEWTDWINKNYPDKKGDFETIASIKEIDLSRCKSPLEIECRSSDNKDVPLELLGQTVTCNTTVGLVCHHKDQTPVPRCYDYEIRVKCCDDKCHSTTSTTEPPTSTSTTEPPTTTSTTEPPTTTSTTEPPTTTSTTEPPTTTSTTEPPTTTSTTEPPTTTSTTEQSTTTSTTEPPTTTSTTEPPTTTSTTEPPTTTTTTEPPTTTSTTEQTTTTTTEQSTTTTEQSTTTTTTEQTPTTICPCEWTDWINKNYPDKKGDFETIASIKEIDLSRCKSPLEIECRSSDNKDVPLELLGQTVTCNTTVGLVCHHKDQTPVPRCYDYEIRVKCCDDKCHSTTSTTEPPTSTSTTEPPTTTSTTEPPTSTSTTEQSTTTSTTEPPTSTSTTEPPTTTSTTEPPTTTSTTEPPTSTSTTEPPTTTSTTEQSTTTSTTELPTTTSTTEPPTSTSTTEPPTSTSTTEPPTTTSTTEPPTSTSTTEPPTSTSTTEPPTSTSTTEPPTTTSTTEPPTTTSTTEPPTTTSTTEPPTTTSTTEPPTTTSTTEPPTTTSTTEPPTSTSTTEPPTSTSTTEPPTSTSTTEPPTTTSTTEPPTTTSTTEPPTTTSTTEQSTTTSTTEPPTSTSTTEPPTTTSTTQQSTTTSTTEQSTSTKTVTTEKTTTESVVTHSEAQHTTKQQVKITTPESTTEPPTSSTTTTTEPTTTTTTTEPPTTTTEPPTTTTEPPTTTTEQPTTTTEQTTTTTTTEQSTTPTTTEQSTSTSTTEPPTSTSTTEQSTTTSTTEQTTTTTTEQTTSSTTTTTEPTTTTTEQPTTITTTEQTTTTTTEQSTTPTTTEQSTTTSTTEPPTSTSKQPTTTSTTEPPTSKSTTLCFCKYMDESFPPGTFIYNETDGNGWCFTSYCNVTCNVEKRTRPCLSTTPATTTSQSTTEPSKSTLSPHCDYLIPPRKNGETWKSSNCSNDTCINRQVIQKHVECPQVDMPVCANDYQPVRVYDQSGCCFQYQCKCICLGWGDPHYVTFDGQYYSFQENCTYVLVKEIVPRNNFSIDIDNENCGTSGIATCTHSMTVYYKKDEIVLTQERSPKTVNKVFVNGKNVFPPFSNKDFTITSTVIEMVVTIPAIEATVLFKGMSFYIDLPYSQFYNNTEGQCGTCDNIQTNDCRLRNGNTHPSCSVMAKDWQIEDKTKPYCKVPPTLNPPTTIITPTKSPATTKKCGPSVFCDIILSSIFAECRKKLPAHPFYEACKYDVCHMPTQGGCASLETFAAMCASEMVCVDWRNSTNGICGYPCPAKKVYKACGSPIVSTCDARYNKKFVEPCKAASNQVQPSCNVLTEGCFCPEGTINFGTNSDDCVETCCAGPDGQPKQLGETWRTGCQTCVCDRDTYSVQCENITCPKQDIVSCDKAGEVLVKRNTADCCNSFECECDVKLCPMPILNCSLGFVPVMSSFNGTCCPTYTCEPTQNCVYNDTLYTPGTSFFKSPCEQCHCDKAVDPTSKLNAISCSMIDCHVQCPLGSVYESVPGQCCGTCKRTSCVVNLPDNSTQILAPSTTWSPPGNNCTKYECVQVKLELTLKESHIQCADFDPDNCIPGTATSEKDGCCKTCTPRYSCQMKKNTTYLHIDDCTSTVPVEITTCQGSCGTSSMYSEKKNALVHACSCCQEVSTIKKEVKMVCSNGKKTTKSYISIDKCGCNTTECEVE